MTRDWWVYFQDVDKHFARFLLGYLEFREQTIKKLIRHLPPNGSIIEIGSGTGIICTLLSSYGYRSLGIDQDPRIVALAQDINRRLKGSANFHVANLFELDESIGHFDIAYSEGVIEHFQGQKLKEALTSSR